MADDVTPEMIKAAWATARQWWPKVVIQEGKGCQCRDRVRLRVVETSTQDLAPHPGFVEAIKAALAARGA